MREAKLLREADIPVADIDVSDRKRPVSEAGVEAIMASVMTTGIMQAPVLVRQVRHQDNRLKLIAGGHRVEVASRLGWDVIPARVYDCTDLWAELTEIDDNLARVDLSHLETAVFLAQRKRAHLQAFPESAQGGDRRSADFQENQTEIISFCSSIAEKRGVSDRQIRSLVAIGEHLTPDAITALQQTPKGAAIRQKDLKALSEVDPDRQHYVADRFASRPDCKTIDLAERAERGEPPVPKPDPVDAHFLKLSDAFSRAPKASRRRFLSQLWAEHRDLMEEEAEAAGWEGDSAD